MRRIVLVIMSTITVVVLLFSYRTSTDSAMVAAGPVTTVSGSAPPAALPRSSTKRSSSTASPSLASFTGDTVDTQWGPVQVRITARGGKITASEAVQYPQSNGRDAEINGFALPILNQEAVRQQSASIDTVSGATVTSDGYLQSLQSAIDKAHL